MDNESRDVPLLRLVGEIKVQQANKEKTRLMVAADGIALADMLIFRQIRHRTAI